MFKSTCALVAIGVIFAAQLPALPKLEPVDEAQADQALTEVRSQVLAAARNHNLQSLMSLISQDVSFGLGREGDSWVVLDQQMVRPEHPTWDWIPRALVLGGAFTTTRGAVLGRREFCAPYTFAAYPEQVPTEIFGEALPWVLTAENVEVHAAPDRRSAILARLSYSLIHATGSERRDAHEPGVVWQTVYLPDEKEAPDEHEGFVLASQIWDPVSFHVCFAKEDGRWMVSKLARRIQP